MQMNSIYQAALDGTLASGGGQGLDNVMIRNDLGIPLRVSWLDYDGNRSGGTEHGWQAGAPGKLVPAGDTWVQRSSGPDQYWLVTSAYSGAFAGVVSFSSSDQTIEFGASWLLGPGDIGELPEPTQEIVIPGDTARVVVGTARLPVGNWLSREQYWQRAAQSYCLAPNETRTVSYTVTSGMSSTSSQQNTVEASVGVSAGVGWGPVSAHMSSNLSTSSTTFQSVTMTTQTTSYVSNVYENDTDQPAMVLFWQLTDELTVFNDSGQPLSSVSLANQPTIAVGPYNPTTVPARPELSVAENATPPPIPTISRHDR